MQDSYHSHLRQDRQPPPCMDPAIQGQELPAQRHLVHQRGSFRWHPPQQQMESFNGNTVRLRENITHGLKKEDSTILAGLRIYHNHVRPHPRLESHITLDEIAGTTIEGNDKILTMIQAADKPCGQAVRPNRTTGHTTNLRPDYPFLFQP